MLSNGWRCFSGEDGERCTSSISEQQRTSKRNVTNVSYLFSWPSSVCSLFIDMHKPLNFSLSIGILYKDVYYINCSKDLILTISARLFSSLKLCNNTSSLDILKFIHNYQKSLKLSLLKVWSSIFRIKC